MQTGSYPFQRILIPYDGSPCAQKALEWTAHLARSGGGAVENVTLLRVIGGSYLARHVQNVDLRVTRMDQVETWQRVRQHYLDHDIMPVLAAGKKILQDQGLVAPVDTKIAEGKIGEEIIRVAAEGGYHALVMGRRGLSPVKGFFLGSVTRQVLSRAQKITVFVLGPEAACGPDCPLPGILVPVDGSEPSLEAVRQGAALAQAWQDGQPRLALLHVIDLANVQASLGETATQLPIEGEKILADSLALASAAVPQGMVEDKLLAGHPAQVIAAQAEEGNFSLILMGARGLSPLKQLVLGSVSQDVLHRAPHAIVGIVYP